MSSRQLLLKLARRHPRLICLNILLGFSGAVFNGVGTALIIPVLLAFLGQPIGDTRGGPPIIQQLLSPFAGAPEETRLLLMSGVILLTLFLKNAANYTNSLVSGVLRRSISNSMREEGIQMLLEVNMDYFVKTSIGDITNCLNNEISRAAAAIASIARIVTLAITTLVFVALLLMLSWQLTLVSTGLVAVVACVNQLNIIRSKKYGKLFSQMSRVYSSGVLDVLTGMRLVRAKATEAQEFKYLQKIIQEREQAEFKNQANSAMIEPISEMTGTIALLLIVIVGRQFMGNHVQELSAILLTYLFLLFRTLPLVAQLNSARNNLANIFPSVEMTERFLRRANKPFMQNGTIPFTNLMEGIHFHHISLVYPGHSKQVLQDVDLYLPRNTTLALVGASGSGKSTLADLLPRFYDPSEGCILVDGIDLRQLDFQSLRRCMGIVSQDTFLFNTSIRNNIAYGYSDATDEAIIAAAKQANAYEFIQQLPEGFETKIGDRGVLLSGGQRQRIAIARALLQNPEILILDEATSALDTVSERLVQQAIDNLSRNRTTLVIAHRLSTVQKADQIAVMDQGRVVELGTHETLIAQKGYYARLCELQLHDSPNDSVDRADSRPTALVHSRSQNSPIHIRLNRLLQKGYYDQLKTEKLVIYQNGKSRNNQISKISYDLRTQLNRLVGSLGLVVGDLVDEADEQRQWLDEAYYSTLHLISSLEAIERKTSNQDFEP